jgi:thermostable 8-oxoguanine DNA glycosylase
MINELLKSKKISPEEADLYMLYQATELGRKVLDRMMLETYMDEPREKEFNGVGFAFYDGRRSVFRDIRRALMNVEDKIKESTNDNGK